MEEPAAVTWIDGKRIEVEVVSEKLSEDLSIERR